MALKIYLINIALFISSVCYCQTNNYSEVINQAIGLYDNGDYVSAMQILDGMEGKYASFSNKDKLNFDYTKAKIYYYQNQNASQASAFALRCASLLNTSSDSFKAQYGKEEIYNIYLAIADMLFSTDNVQNKDVLSATQSALDYGEETGLATNEDKLKYNLNCGAVCLFGQNFDGLDKYMLSATEVIDKVTYTEQLYGNYEILAGDYTDYQCPVSIGNKIKVLEKVVDCVFPHINPEGGEVWTFYGRIFNQPFASINEKNDFELKHGYELYKYSKQWVDLINRNYSAYKAEGFEAFFYYAYEPYATFALESESLNITEKTTAIKEFGTWLLPHLQEVKDSLGDTIFPPDSMYFGMVKKLASKITDEDIKNNISPKTTIAALENAGISNLPIDMKIGILSKYLSSASLNRSISKDEILEACNNVEQEYHSFLYGEDMTTNGNIYNILEARFYAYYLNDDITNTRKLIYDSEKLLHDLIMNDNECEYVRCVAMEYCFSDPDKYKMYFNKLGRYDLNKYSQDSPVTGIDYIDQSNEAEKIVGLLSIMRQNLSVDKEIIDEAYNVFMSKGYDKVLLSGRDEPESLYSAFVPVLYQYVLEEKHDTTTAINELQRYYDLYTGKYRQYCFVDAFGAAADLLASIYNSRNMPDKALTYCNEMLEEHPDYYFIDDIIDDKTDALVLKLNSKTITDEERQWLSDVSGREIENSIKNTESYMRYLSKKERTEYWEKIWSSNEWNVGKYINSFKDINSCDGGLLYDSKLFLKGMSTRVDNSIRDAVYASNDSKLVSLYERIGALETQLIHENDATIAQEADSLSIVLSQQLILSANGNNERWDWKRVQKNLDDNDIAVEFLMSVDFHDINDIDSIITTYYALTLKKSYTSPHVVKLCDLLSLRDWLWSDNNIREDRHVNRLYEDGNDKNYHGEEIYNITWGKLEDELQGVKNIYYSPDELLNKVAMQAISRNSIPMIDRYNMYQVTSTREIEEIKQDKKCDISNAQIYGGIKYAADATASYLEGSLAEAKSIDGLLSKNKVSSTLYTDMQATEESFKALGRHGSSPDLIHIATHGFYTNGENPMASSGLLMAGAKAVDNECLPDDANDGILYSREIAQMDLTNTKLVTLSACETGSGESGKEGVSGLQLAFKLAGVQSIIMSMWKVSDEVTSELMQSFYTKWIKTKDIHRAFKDAQKEIKEKYPNPYYWAAFVMLD